MVFNGGELTKLSINDENRAIAQAVVEHYERCIFLAAVSEESS